MPSLLEFLPVTNTATVSVVQNLVRELNLDIIAIRIPSNHVKCLIDVVGKSHSINLSISSHSIMLCFVKKLDHKKRV